MPLYICERFEKCDATESERIYSFKWSQANYFIAPII